MELIYTDREHRPLGILTGFTLDMAFGSDENDFELSVPISDRLLTGGLAYQYGTDRGGIIDAERYDSTGDTPVMVYRGRTWHGIMAKSVVSPDGGQSHLTVSGSLTGIIRSIISRQGLGDVFEAMYQDDVQLGSVQIPRYVTMYEALSYVVSQAGMRLVIRKGSGKVQIGFADVENHVSGVVGGLAPMVIERAGSVVNHLVLLGKGELDQRLVLDVYADAQGRISTTKTLFGVNEIAEVYELSNEEDPARLLNAGFEKLAKMQERSKVVIPVPAGEEYAIGDIVTGVATDIGLSVQAEVVKQIVSVDKDGVESVSCIVGEPTLTEME